MKKALDNQCFLLAPLSEVNINQVIEYLRVIFRLKGYL